MIKLKAFYRVGKAPDATFLMSENQVHRLEPDVNGLVDKLQAGLEPDTVTDAELEQLRELQKLGVVYVEPTVHPQLLNYLEHSGWRTSYVLEQLAHARVRVVNEHPDPSYAQDLAAALNVYGLIDDVLPSLVIYVVDVLSKLEAVSYPGLLVKLGSYRVAVGPVLSKFTPVESFNSFYLQGKGYFEHEAFLADLPVHLRAAQVALVTHEVLMLLVKGGSHEANGAIIDWDMATMKRQVWQI